MAKIKFGAIAADARGKIGGIVFSKNSSSAYIRKRTVPVNVNSPRQNIVRSLFAAIAVLWRTLTNGQRQTWENQRENYPATNSLGDVIIYTAQQLFTKHNNNLSQAGQPTITIGKPPVSFSDIAFLNPQIENLSNTFEIDTSDLGPNEIQVVEATRDMSQGISFVGDSDFRQVFVTDPGASGGSNDITANYLAVFGKEPNDMTVGNRLFVRTKLVNLLTGQASVVSQTTVIVAA